MDWKRFDRVRGNVGPVHLDLVESYAAGRITRREFMRRGAVVGLSLPMIGAVIAARRRRAGRGATDHAPGAGRGDSRAARSASATRRPAGARPDPDAGPRHLRHRRPVLRVPRHARRRRRASHRASPSRGSPTRRHDVWTFKLRQGVKWQRRHRLHVRRRGGHDGPPRRGRRTPASQGVIAAGAVDATDPNVAVFTLAAPNGNLPYLVSVFNAQTRDHAGRATRPARRSTRRRTAPGRGSSTRSTPRPARRSCATRTGGAAQTPLDGQRVQFFDRPRHDGHRHPGRRGRRASCSSR